MNTNDGLDSNFNPKKRKFLLEDMPRVLAFAAAIHAGRLEAIAMQVDFNDTEIRNILGLYGKSEFEKWYNEVYAPIMPSVPSLRFAVDELKKEVRTSDPIEISNKSMMDIEKTRRDLNSIASEYPNLWRLAESLQKVLSAAEYHVKAERDVYDKIATSVKRIASLNRIPYEKVISEQQHRDEIMRMVFPTRDAAEKYYESTQKFTENFIELSRQLLLLPPIFNDHSPIKLLNQLPKREELQILFAAERTYFAKEFGRVYSNRK